MSWFSIRCIAALAGFELIWEHRALKATGCSFEINHCIGDYCWECHNSSGVLNKDENQARLDIVKSIDAGFPVLAFGIIGPPECCIVTGYDDDGQVLMGYNYLQDYIKDDDFGFLLFFSNNNHALHPFLNHNSVR